MDLLNFIDFAFKELNKPYYANVCRICLKYADKRCASCKAFGYCSKEHQALDWDVHKIFCKKLRRLNVTYTVGCSFEEFELEGKMYLRALFTFFDAIERQILIPVVMKPMVCAICYSKNNLFECPNCLVVWYCSREHQAQHVQHEIYCESLKLSRSLEVFNDPPEKFHFIDVIHKNVKYLPKDTRDLFRIIKKIGSAFGPETYNQFLFSTIAADVLSIGATILYGLEKFGSIQMRNFVRRRLVIHLVSTEIDEDGISCIALAHILLKWINNVKTILVIIFDNQRFSSNVVNFSKHSKTLTIVFLPKTYNSEILFLGEKPDIVVDVNSDYNEAGRDCLSFLLYYKNVPLVVTSVTENILQNNLRLLQLSQRRVEVILTPQKNPFAGLVPYHLSIFYDGTEKVFFDNAYLTVLKRKN